MENKIFHFSDFKGADILHSFELAMTSLRENPNSTLVVEPGTYVLTSELARETQRAVMAGEYGKNPQKTDCFGVISDYCAGNLEKWRKMMYNQYK